MKNHLSIVFIIMASSLLIACSSVTIDDYAGKTPAVNLEDFFTGDLVAYGIVRDRSGKMTRHFQAALKGSWQDGVGTLDELFWFDDGEKQNRVWKMTPTEDGKYIGTAGDVEGNALIESKGNAIRLAYRLTLPYKNKEITVSMDDWMYQVAPGVIINETLMSKWGFHVATVTLVIMKSDVSESIPVLIDRFDK